MENTIRIIVFILVIALSTTIIKSTDFKSIPKKYNNTEICEEPLLTTKVSWYGPGFHGRVTANGDIYNQNLYTCASPILPFNTLLEVINPNNNKCIIVRVNDRGPFKMDSTGVAIYPLQPHPIRSFDLSKASFEYLSNLNNGVITIKYRILITGGDWN